MKKHSELDGWASVPGVWTPTVVAAIVAVFAFLFAIVVFSAFVQL